MMHSRSARSTLALLLGGLLAAVSARAEQQTEPASTSKLAGVTLPAGALRVLAPATVEQARHALEGILRQANMQPGPTEVLVWPTSGGFTVEDGAAAVSAALKKAGYDVRSADPPAGAAASLKRLLVAKSDKRTLIGFWAASDALVTLAWCHPSAAGSTTSGTAADAMDAGTAVGDPSAPPAFPKLQAAPNTVTGYTVDRSGKPLAGVEISVHGTTLKGERSNINMHSGPDGRFKSVIPDGAWAASMATYPITFHGQLYHMPLRFAGGPREFSGAEGGVANFYMPLTGKIDPTLDIHYGGDIRVDISELQSRLGGRLPQATIVLTLTPDGPLIDGSTGRVVVSRQTVDLRNSFKREMNVVDIPLGAYRAGLRIELPDGSSAALPAVVEIGNAGRSMDRFDAAEKPLYFPPAEAGYPGTAPAWIRIRLTGGQ